MQEMMSDMNNFKFNSNPPSAPISGSSVVGGNSASTFSDDLESIAPTQPQQQQPFNNQQTQHHQLPQQQHHHHHQQQHQVRSIPPQQQHQSSHPQQLGQSGNNNYFNDLSQYWSPYGIDISHFPLTNPPIFESALMMNNQGQPRRRISISNGQIGQITNTHNVDELYELQPPPLPKAAGSVHHSSTQSVSLGNTPQSLNQMYTSGALQQQPGKNLQNVPVGMAQPLQPQQQQQQQQQHIDSSPIQRLPPPQPQQTLHPQQQQQQYVQPMQPQMTQQQQPQSNLVDANGVPNHKLMYNNEVIFNPDAGPIPGTAAWKKARLLERNRIAALKCRQRKKAAQIQLKEDVAKYNRKIELLNEESTSFVKFYHNLKKNVADGIKLNSDEVQKMFLEFDMKLIQFQERKQLLDKDEPPEDDFEEELVSMKNGV
ncbi:hypothetical protein WICPIJ_006789 [Wickerhamomyces pijperi]|uniref:BZIP domain-containing protein n=1 Tax=Wickerhamomyces pijperi TaxID=599730 RepID=A0A9P8TKP2_WICPI|nr:hypothetical protein WICPIJ_006789 [Wickerhamomyces pijperi]